MGRLNVNDFAYLGVVQASPSMLFVVIDSPIKNYQQLLDAAKANPGKLKVATAGFGLDDFAVKFLTKKGFAMVNAPYAKPAERYASILGKHTDVLFEEPGHVTQFLAAKQMRPTPGIWREASSRNFQMCRPPANLINISTCRKSRRALVTAPTVPKDRLEALIAGLAKVTDTAEWKKFCSETYTCIPKMNSCRQQEVRAEKLRRCGCVSQGRGRRRQEVTRMHEEHSEHYLQSLVHGTFATSARRAL